MVVTGGLTNKGLVDVFILETGAVWHTDHVTFVLCILIRYIELGLQAKHTSCRCKDGAFNTV